MYREIIFSLIRYLDGTAGNIIRRAVYRKRLKYLGKNVIIDTGVFMYGLKYIAIGDNTHIDKSCILIGSSSDLDLSERALKEKYNSSIHVNKGELVIGSECHIAQNCMIFAYGGVKLGNNCVMSSGSKLYSLSSLHYNPEDKNLRTSIVPYSGKSPSIIGNIEFEDNVWIGINSCVFPGVKIGKDSFIRSNSMVSESFSENSYIAGDPAKYIKQRYGGQS
jgi:acetyltransferase-like isoleucine patch superfamily enzyme